MRANMRQFQTLLRPTLVVLATLFAGSCGDNANRVAPLAPSPLDSAAPVLRDTIPGTVNRVGAATLSTDDKSKDDDSKDDDSKDNDSKDDRSKDDASKDDESKDDKSKNDKSDKSSDKSKDDKSKGTPCTSKTPQGIVECRRNQYGHMSSSQIVAFLRGVAKDLNAAGIGGGPFGILRKSGGYNCGGYSCDIICSGQGTAQRQWDVLSDAEGAQKPVWNGPKTSPNIRVDACEIQGT